MKTPEECKIELVNEMVKDKVCSFKEASYYINETWNKCILCIGNRGGVCHNLKSPHLDKIIKPRDTCEQFLCYLTFD